MCSSRNQGKHVLLSVLQTLHSTMPQVTLPPDPRQPMSSCSRVAGCRTSPAAAFDCGLSNCLCLPVCLLCKWWGEGGEDPVDIAVHSDTCLYMRDIHWIRGFNSLIVIADAGSGTIQSLWTSACPICLLFSSILPLVFSSFKLKLIKEVILFFFSGTQEILMSQRSGGFEPPSSLGTAQLTLWSKL